MSEHLDHLYAAMHRQGQSSEQAEAAREAYRWYAVALAEGLPFPCRLVGVKSTRYATNLGAVHITAAEDVERGQPRRGAPATRSISRGAQFSGGLGGLNELRPAEKGASCVKCLAVAEAHSIVEWQAS